MRAFALAFAFVLAVPAVAGAAPRHAIAMHGEPALPPDFFAPPWVNPDAPKGGRLTLAVAGTFDSLNPFIVKGIAAEGLRTYVVESLLARGHNEAFTLYGLLAQTVDTDEARSFVTFALDPRARFSDGSPVTADDVRFSFELLRDRGRPNHRTYYAKVRAVEVLDARTIRFDLAGAEDRELPLILGLMPIFPRHATDATTFEQTSFRPPVGSGPYVVADVEPGRSLLLKRNPAYWGRELAITRGSFNFDEIRFDYFRDDNAQFEAFKRGLVDVRFERDPTRWATGYDIPARRAGRLVTEAIPNGLPKPMFALVFNLRRPLFADRRVRLGLIELFDFSWINDSLYFGLYRRTGSFFAGSELSALGRPASAAERALLAPFPDAVPADVLEGRYAPPTADGSGRDRAALRRAIALFAEAGFHLSNGALRDRAGRPLRFEILVVTRDQQRLAMAYAHMLARAGIAAAVRLVDAVQFESRRQTYDFDMIPNTWDQSLSPGNEQAFYFGSAAADTPGTRNYMGAKSPATDAMIAALLAARDRPALVAAVRALDRTLIAGAYVVPLFHLPAQWVARWSRIARPATDSVAGALPETWWVVAP